MKTMTLLKLLEIQSLSNNYLLMFQILLLNVIIKNKSPLLIGSLEFVFLLTYLVSKVHALGNT